MCDGWGPKFARGDNTNSDVEDNLAVANDSKYVGSGGFPGSGGSLITGSCSPKLVEDVEVLRQVGAMPNGCVGVVGLVQKGSFW